MNTHPQVTSLQGRVLIKAGDSAARAIPPVWPLASSVAVLFSVRRARTWRMSQPALAGSQLCQ
jgi:hypothetical protein